MLTISMYSHQSFFVGGTHLVIPERPQEQSRALEWRRHAGKTSFVVREDKAVSGVIDTPNVYQYRATHTGGAAARSLDEN